MTAATFRIVTHTLAELGLLKQPVAWEEAEKLVRQMGLLPGQEHAALVELQRHHESQADGPRCPTCGKIATFTERFASNAEPHGEHFNDVWLTCDLCGSRTDEEEVDNVGHKPF